MTTKAEEQTTEDEVIVAEEEETEETSSEEETNEADDAEAEEEPGSEEESSVSDDDEVVVTIGDEAPPQEEEQAPEWVRKLRKSHRETQRENRELREKLEATTQSETKPVALGKKPTLEEHDYDTEKYEQELTAWYEQKRKADELAAKQKDDETQQQQAWQEKLNGYGDEKSKLKVKDFDDAEAVALEALNQTQQGIIIQGADNSALVIYALGKNPERMKELASINDPVKFAFAVAKLEKDLKVKNRKAPPPERTVTGTGSSSGAVDSTLERLRAEAEKSGNYTKVTEYKRQKRQAQT